MAQNRHEPVGLYACGDLAITWIGCPNPGYRQPAPGFAIMIRLSVPKPGGVR
jgi:hypothetical protein